MTQHIAEQRLKERLRLSRSTLHCTLTPAQRAEVKGLLKEGFSKKAVCLVYSVPYTELKGL